MTDRTHKDRDNLVNKMRYCWAAITGKRVSKKSGKPFKSGHKINTVIGLTRSSTPNIRGRLCYRFKEDDSYVECWRCISVLKGAKNGTDS